jgi:hypothetical protein
LLDSKRKNVASGKKSLLDQDYVGNGTKKALVSSNDV